MENPAIVSQMPERYPQEAIDQINKKCYDNCAYIWDRFPFPDVLPNMIEKYYNPQLGNHVLDVGSGTGMLAKWLHDKGFDVLCIDPSSEMVRRCKEKGLNILQVSLQSYVPDSQFSMIFAILSLIHVPKAEFSSQIIKLANALPPNGILFLGMLEGNDEGVFEDGKYPRFFAYYTAEEILTKTKPYFIKLDYHYIKSDGIGYMLFALKKI